MDFKKVSIILITGLLLYLFLTTFHVIEGYENVVITSSNGQTEVVYDTSNVDFFFTEASTIASDTSLNNLPQNYYADNGNKCVLSNNTIVVTTVSGTTTNYVSSNASAAALDQVFYDNMGGYAKIFSDGIHYFVEVQPYNGPLFVLTSTPPPATTAPATSPYQTAGGIPYSMIPSGEEDLYILKSEVVPPVCPKCPDYSALPSSSAAKCPPCPACARCPEPSFECKKVPNYQSIDQNSLPTPVLSDFSTFGL